MLNKIIHYSLHNRLVVVCAAILLLIAGTYTAMHTEVDVFPDLNAPTVVIMTEANGMAAEEVEQLVTFPVETAVNGATGVRRVRSSSTNGFSVVWVEFDWGTDIYLARQIVSEKLAVVSESLPVNVGKPTLGPQSSILGEMLIIGLTADSTSMLDLRTIADWTIRPRLLSTGGVAQVAVLGGDIKEYQIQLDPERMRHYGISMGEVMAVTQDMNLNANGGVLYEFGNEYIVRGVLSTSKTEQLGKAVVKTVNNFPVTLEDIANVTIGPKAPKLGTASERGKSAVLMTVTKQPATSTLELTDKLEASLKDLQKNLPPDVKVSTDIFRQSRFIESSIGNVKKSLFEGGIFVVIVLFLFLANVRTTLISLVTLPLSLLVSILTLHYMGLTINTMSLGGMAIAIGSLVDDAIVDVENVYKRLRENRLKVEAERLSTLEVVFNASKEVRMPILNSTLIIVVSFVPLFFLSGMEGRMLVPLGVAFIVALFASTIVALTLTPVLCSYLLGSNKTNKELKEAPVARWMKTLGIVAFVPQKFIVHPDAVHFIEDNTISVKDVFAGAEWFPTATPAAQFGFLPLITGTLWVSLFAILFALPFGLSVSIYMSEVANPKVRNWLKPIIELLSGIPSVVYGFFGLIVIVPLIQKLFNLPVGESGLAGSIVLAIMALPTIITVTEDAMRNCPRAMREASLALGASQWQTIYKVVIPYSISGITSGVVLGIGRAIGETMAVLMVTGNAAVIPTTILEPLRTIPATIAAELGEAPAGGPHYQALFLLGVVLFFITLIINFSVEYISSKGLKRSK